MPGASTARIRSALPGPFAAEATHTHIVARAGPVGPAQPGRFEPQRAEIRPASLFGQLPSADSGRRKAGPPAALRPDCSSDLSASEARSPPHRSIARDESAPGRHGRLGAFRTPPPPRRCERTRRSRAAVQAGRHYRGAGSHMPLHRGISAVVNDKRGTEDESHAGGRPVDPAARRPQTSLH